MLVRDQNTLEHCPLTSNELFGSNSSNSVGFVAFVKKTQVMCVSKDINEPVVAF